MQLRVMMVGPAMVLAVACSSDDGGDGSMEGAQMAMPAPGANPAADPAATGMTGTAGQMGMIDPQQIMDIVDMLLPDCDPNVPVTATCGGVTCEPQNQLTAALCVVPCCALDETGAEACGSRSADLAMPDSVCEVPPPPAEPDPLCPEFDAGMGTLLPGCCMETGVCGVISSITSQCITESQFITLPASPPPCDGSGLGAAPDGGTMGAPDGGTMDAPDAGM
ncbi:MAG: hypothetical protein OXT09_04760 [Myxococcales bacterium]|nr:hypothetical protein [Myxococcales bacterium]